MIEWLCPILSTGVDMIGQLAAMGATGVKILCTGSSGAGPAIYPLLSSTRVILLR